MWVWCDRVFMGGEDLWPGIQDGYSEAFTQCRTPPFSSVGLASPSMSTPATPKAHAYWGDEADVSTANSHWPCCLLLAHLINGYM